MHTLTCAHSTHYTRNQRLLFLCERKGLQRCHSKQPRTNSSESMPGALNSQSCSGEKRPGFSTVWTVACQERGRGKCTLNEICSASYCSCSSYYPLTASYSYSMTLEVQTHTLLLFPSVPLSCPPCSHPCTSKPLTHLTLSEFLSLISPSSLLTSSLVIFLDFLVASHLFILPFFSSLFLPLCPTTRHLPSGSVTADLPSLPPPPVPVFTFLASCCVSHIPTYHCKVGFMFEHSVTYWKFFFLPFLFVG